MLAGQHADIARGEASMLMSTEMLASEYTAYRGWLSILMIERKISVKVVDSWIPSRMERTKKDGRF